jgi:hypothetical protein
MAGVVDADDQDLTGPLDGRPKPDLIQGDLPDDGGRAGRVEAAAPQEGPQVGA